MQAATKTWTATTGDWFVDANWGGNPYPTNGDDVVITNAGASVLLTNSTASLVSLTLSKTLVFSNWNTKLSATNVTILSGGTVTLPSAFTDTQMSNNVYFVCSNLTLATNGQIDVSAKGYIGRIYTNGYGPGAGQGGYNLLCGAGHGGFGGGGSYATSYGIPYGESNAPIIPGSSGGGNNPGWGGTGGNGGGAVRIAAQGTVTVDGLISADAGNSSGLGTGGSGGSIYITCAVIAGTSGVLRANGGNDISYTPGGGAGGRIAVVYNTTLQALAPVPVIQCQVAGYTVNGNEGDVGTLYFPDTRLLTENLNWSGQIIIPGFTHWTVNNLTISNGWVRFPPDGFNLTVSNNLVLDGSATRLQVGAAVFRIMNTTPIFSGGVIPSALSVGGNLTLTNGGCLYMYGAETNGGQPAFGARVSVAGDMYVGSNSWVYPQSHPTNGGSVSFQMRNLTIDGINGGFNANAPRGFSAGISGHTTGFGPGGGTGGGGSYGGLGGRESGPTYGASNAPVQPGSGGAGAGNTPGAAGGLVYLLASRTVTFRGILTANGAGNSWGGGAGSGGGIFIRCMTFIGSTAGSLQAKGGDVYYSGGGGGGRIAVWRVRDQSDGPVGISVAGGASGGDSSTGSPGTIVWGWMPRPGTIISAN